jgi:hypothetical protein
MNVVLTASFDKGLFCNGLNQNIVFLAELIKDIGFNPIIAINHKMDDCVDPPFDILIVEKHEFHDLESVDILLQTGWVVENGVIDYFKNKNSSFKNIHVHYGNRLLADIEQCKWDNICIPSYRVDEAWVSPHYDFSIEYFKTYYNTQKVFELPYIWSSKYVDIHESIWNKAGKSCFYDPEDPKNIAIIEPNLNMTKNCIPSIFIAEEAYRKDPNIFNKLTVYCSDNIRNKNYFKSLMWQLDITKDQKIDFASRKKISNIFANEASIVVSHQLMNALNYTYLEALHFNIPLIHNSSFIKSAGYYYPDYNTIKGGECLCEALTFHDKNLTSYSREAERIKFKYSPQNPDVVQRYKKLFS